MTGFSCPLGQRDRRPLIFLVQRKQQEKDGTGRDFLRLGGLGLSAPI